jgi:hypothetical protein
VGEPGSDRADGGDDSDGDELYGWCWCCGISIFRWPPVGIPQRVPNGAAEEAGSSEVPLPAGLETINGWQKLQQSSTKIKHKAPVGVVVPMRRKQFQENC